MGSSLDAQEKAGKWQVPIPKVKAMTEDEMFKIPTERQEEEEGPKRGGVKACDGLNVLRR